MDESERGMCEVRLIRKRLAVPSPSATTLRVQQAHNVRGKELATWGWRKEVKCNVQVLIVKLTGGNTPPVQGRPARSNRPSPDRFWFTRHPVEICSVIHVRRSYSATCRSKSIVQRTLAPTNVSTMDRKFGFLQAKVSTL